jgi:hypothetical protein
MNNQSIKSKPVSVTNFEKRQHLNTLVNGRRKLLDQKIETKIRRMRFYEEKLSYTQKVLAQLLKERNRL